MDMYCACHDVLVQGPKFGVYFGGLSASVLEGESRYLDALSKPQVTNTPL